MKLFLLAVCVAVCSAGRLENTYLPPGNAQGAGGNGNILNVPGHSHNGAGAFGGVQAQGPVPAYGAPSVEANYRSNNFGHNAPQVPILKFNNENNGDGGYRYEYETANGIQAQEAGQLKNAGSDYASNDVQGSYSYTGPDGVTYTVHYTADENGFHPQGDHLPTPPPVPEVILKSLRDNAAAEAQRDQHGGAGQYNNGANQQFAAPARQYAAAPQKPSFNPNTGYNY
ncbi:Cuticular protein 47Ef [Carabus blaptoides fortunei]